MRRKELQFFLPMKKPPTVTNQAKELHAFMRNGKPCAVLHDTPELKNAKAKFHAALKPYAPANPFHGPVQLVVKWCFPIEDPKKQWNGKWKTTKPDTDNLMKAFKDQMTRLHFWDDDAQVTSEISQKFWAKTPGIFVQITPLEG